jgi:hypothetical protein
MSPREQLELMRAEFGATVSYHLYFGCVEAILFVPECRLLHESGVGFTEQDAFVAVIKRWNARPDKDELVFNILASRAHVHI